MGLMYDLQDGVPYDRNQAINWYIKAAKLGHLEAQYNLVLSYQMLGDNYLDEAIYWCKICAQAGHEEAMMHLEELLNLSNQKSR